MSYPKGVLLNILAERNERHISNDLNPLDLAEIYIDVAFLDAALSLIKDSHWLEQKQNKDFLYDELLQRLFQKELKPIYYLQNLFLGVPFSELSKFRQFAKSLESTILKTIGNKEFPDQRSFLFKVLKGVQSLFIAEEALKENCRKNNSLFGLSLYRTFDSLDLILNLDYQLDHNMFQNPETTERLYEGAGVGVQSGYSTILLALENLQFQDGDHIIDLGSGYGRVGLVVGILYPQLNFTGYEYVPHRVERAQLTSQNLGISQQVRFHVQDLSQTNFLIPEAEVFYMYDPFTDETYHHVLHQLMAMGNRKKISIITKGNARHRLTQMTSQSGWPPHQEFDNGNLCIFKSV